MPAILDCDPTQEIPTADMTGLLTFLVGLPCPATRAMRVPGLTLDMHHTQDEDYGIVISEAQMRQGVLGSAAKCKWGMDTGVLKMTHDAVITSILRNAFVVTGS